MQIGKIIKENRIARGLTQEELAKAFYVSRPLISKWENGKSYPDLEQLLKLSDFFDLTLDELLRGDKKMTKKINTAIKRKPLFIGIISILTIILCSIGFIFWTDQIVQLTPSDIDVTSVKIEQNSSIDKINSSTGEKESLPTDVSYIIKYKIKKPLTDARIANYFDSDQNNIYVDMRGHNALFPSKKEHTLIINSDSKVYGENTQLKIDENYISKTIRDKNIKILDINSLTTYTSVSDAKSWLLIKKINLESKN